MAGKTNRNMLENSIQRLGRILADRYDINIVYEGEKIFTDGKTIYLPAILSTMAEDKIEEFAQVMHGYLDHEVAHILFTQLNAIKHIQSDPVTNAWGQIMEDVRIEAKMAELWKGSKENFDYSEKWLTDRMFANKWNDATPSTKLIYTAMLMAKNSPDLSIVPEQEYVEVLEDNANVKHALSLARNTNVIKSTMHAIALAKYVMKELGLHPSEPSKAESKAMEEIEEACEEMAAMEAPTDETLPPPPKSADKGETEEGDDGAGGGGTASDEDDEAEDGKGGASEDGTEDGETDSGGSIDEDGEEESEDGDSSESDTAEEEEKEKKTIADLGINPSEAPDMSKASLADAINSSMKGYVHHNPKNRMHYCAKSTKVDRIQVEKDGSKEWFAKQIQASRQVAGVMTRKLKTFLVSRQKKLKERDKTSGYLDKKALPRLIVLGDNRVFYQHGEKEIQHCRFSLLIDLSGSMSGFGDTFSGGGKGKSKVEFARDATIVFGEFLHAMKVPFEVAGFSTLRDINEHTQYNKASATEKAQYTRWGGLDYSIFKEFHEDWRKVGHRVEKMSPRIQNYDGESVKLAAQRLLRAQKDPKERLVLFVLSDGLPAQGVVQYEKHHQWYLKQVVGEVEKAGVELVGFGILTDAVKNYYKNHIVLKSANDLIGAELEKLKEFLLSNKKKRRF